MRTAYFTICSVNYLAYARTLAESVARQDCGVEFICFLVDEVRGRFDCNELGFRVVETKDVGCPWHFDMAARYSVMEMNTAIKPFCFEYLFRNGVDRAAYIDPDIIVVSPLTELHEAWDAGASIVLTPHSLTPLDDGKDPDDVRLMRTGAYNLGFGGVRRTPAGEAFVAWWGRHLLNDCIVDLENGIFVDQKFCDLAPCYFDGTFILRHPGYNVAYWNLLGRTVTRDADGTWRANGELLRFFHFSGVVPGDRTVFSKHQDRFTVYDIGEAKLLLEHYLDRLDVHAKLDGEVLAKLPYVYATFRDGTPLTDFMRRAYRAARPPAPLSYEKAFEPDHAPYVMLAPEVKQEPGVPITRLMMEVYNGRRDVQTAFPLGSPEGRRGLVQWFLSSATREHRIPACIIESTRELLAPDRLTKGGIVLSTDAESVPAELRGDRWVAQRRLPGSMPADLAMIGYFTAENGLGSALRANYRAARDVGLRVDAFALPSNGFESKVPFPHLSTKPVPDGDCVLLHVNADSAHTVANHLDPRALRGRHRIGYWAWELPILPIEWIGAFDHVDEVWVPSRFTQEAVAARSKKPVIVVPHPIILPEAPRRPIAELRAEFGLPPDRFLFLTAFDLNSYINRKNPFAVLEAFEHAFPVDDSAGPMLVVKLHGRAHRNRDWNRLMTMVQRNRNVRLIDGVLPVQAIDDLQWACDSFVSLHRSEGFGLWIAECMGRGKPCIVTDFSGNTDITDSGCTLSVGFSMTLVGKEEYPFGAGQWWAEPDLSSAVDAMRLVVRDSSARERIGAAAQVRVRRDLASTTIGRLIRRRLFGARAELIDLPPVLVGP
jgi:glycosyltransferase involved in cell wall biosynthesis